MSELLGALTPFPGLQVVQHTIGLTFGRYPLLTLYAHSHNFMYIVVGELGCSTFHQPYTLNPTRFTRHDFLIILWTHLRRNAVVIREWCCLSSRKNRSYIPADPLSTGDFKSLESKGQNRAIC